MAQPEWFAVRGRSAAGADGPCVELRWRIHPAIGLPLAPFRVWVLERLDPTGEALAPAVCDVQDGSRRVGWGGRGAAMVTVATQVGAGQQLVLRAMSGVTGGGVALDERIAGPGTTSVRLAGSAIRSVAVYGAGAVVGASAVWLDALVDDAGWVPIERVGLPVDRRGFGGTGYDLGWQGPVHAPCAPREAAIRRVRRGLPAGGWPATTDLGEPAPPWVPVDPEAWVDEVAGATLPRLARMLRDTDRPVAHEGYALPDGAPLLELLRCAGADPAGALALGFGTTVRAQGVAAVMVTVDHEVPAADGALVERVLADVFLRPVSLGPPAPTGLVAASLGLERPARRDEPRLASIELSWTRVAAALPDDPVPTSHAILRDGVLAHPPRAAGGIDPAVADPIGARVRWVDPGRPEPPPGASGALRYAVASQDWFGRWSGWATTSVTVAPAPPAVPQLVRIALDRDAVTIDLAWDWSDRAPNRIEVQLALHPPGTPPAGSNRALGGPRVPDVGFTFGADPDVAPPGLERLPPEPGAPPELRTYRARISGFEVEFGSIEAVVLSGRARADEAFRPGVWSPFGPDRSVLVARPAAPAVGAVPMVWACAPDAAGVARARLTWPAVRRAVGYVVYTADEASILREVGAPAPDPRVRPDERLRALRAVDAAAARRVFRPLERVPEPSVDVDLPRESHAIYCFAVVPVREPGEEGSLPADANEWIAVAAPRVVCPPAPRLRVRPTPGRAAVVVEVDGDAPASVELYRVSAIVGSVERMGPPVHVWSAADAAPIEGGVAFTAVDAGAPTWVDLTYRAVAWAAAAPERGELAGRTVGPVGLAVVPSAAPPSVVDRSPAGQSGPWRLVQLAVDPSPTRCRAGAHQLSIAIRTAGTTELRRVAAVDAPTFPEPPPPEHAPPIFRAAPPGGAATFAAWIAVDGAPVEIVARVLDPAGRSTAVVVRP